MPKAFVAPPEAPPSLADVPATYEAAVQELEALVSRMETGQMPLDGLLSGYQRGAQLLQACRARLDAVEEQIRVLDQGVIKPWEQA